MQVKQYSSKQLINMIKIISTLALSIFCLVLFGQSNDQKIIGVQYYKYEERSDFRPNEFLQPYLDSLSTDQYKLILVNTFVEGQATDKYADNISDMDFILDVYENKFRVALEDYVPSVTSKKKVITQPNGLKIYPKDYFYRIGYSMRLVDHLSHEYKTSFGHSRRMRKSAKDNILYPLTEREKKIISKNGKVNRKVDMSLVPFRKINKPFAQYLARALYNGVAEGLEQDLRMVNVVERKKSKVKKIEVTSVAPYHSLKKQQFVSAYTTIDRGEYYTVETLANFSGVDMDTKICNIGWGKKELAKAIDNQSEIRIAQTLDIKYKAPQPFDWKPLKIGVIVDQVGSEFTDVNMLKLASNIEFKLSYLKEVTVIDRVSISGLSELKKTLKSGDISDKVYDKLESSMGVDILMFAKVLKVRTVPDRAQFISDVELSLVDVKTGELLGASQESIIFNNFQGDYNLESALPALKKLMVGSMGWTPEVVKFDKIDKDERVVIKCRYPLVDGADYILYSVKEEKVAGKVLERKQQIGEVEIEDLHSIDCASAEIEEGKKKIRKAVEQGMKLTVEEKGIEKKEKSKGLLGIVKSSFTDIFNFNDYEIRKKYY